MLTTHHADSRRSQALTRGTLRRAAAVLLAGVLVTGCVAETATAPQGAGAETGTSRDGTSGSTAEQSASASEGAAAADQSTPEPAAGQPTAPLPKIASVPPIELLGMSREDIIKNLGTPVFQRRDHAALLLRYREGRCILDVYLYPHNPSGSARTVDYFEARNEDGQQIETKPCIDAVRKANGTG